MLKTAYLNKQKDNVSLSYYELRNAAGEKERAGDFAAAIGLYQQCIKRRPRQEWAYHRLMILYRKQKEYKKEMATVKTAIKVFEALYKPKQIVSRMVAVLSKQIIKAMDLANDKGKQRVDMGPLSKWRKRLQFLEKRLYK